MGQRSEIYVAYETQNGEKKIVARYFQWNYGEHMISRIAFTAIWLKKHVKHSIDKNDLISIIETDFDFVDHQKSADIVQKREGRSERLSIQLDNDLNDGRGFLFVSRDGTVKYCFTKNNEIKPLDCCGYMLFDTESCYPQYQWINEEYKKSERMSKCREHIKWLCRNAGVMTQEELDEFVHADYIA